MTNFGLFMWSIIMTSSFKVRSIIYVKQFTKLLGSTRKNETFANYRKLELPSCSVTVSPHMLKCVSKRKKLCQANKTALPTPHLFSSIPMCSWPALSSHSPLLPLQLLPPPATPPLLPLLSLLIYIDAQTQTNNLTLGTFLLFLQMHASETVCYSESEVTRSMVVKIVMEKTVLRARRNDMQELRSLKDPHVLIGLPKDQFYDER